MWIDVPDPCCGPLPLPADFSPPRPIPIPPSEVLPILFEHGFTRWLPDGLLPWLVVFSAAALTVAGLALVAWWMVKRDRAIPGE